MDHFAPDGDKTKRSTIGAVVRLAAKIDGEIRWQARHISGQERSCSQIPEVHFGLRYAESIEEIIITWPAAGKTMLKDIGINQVLRIVEDRDC